MARELPPNQPVAIGDSPRRVTLTSNKSVMNSVTMLTEIVTSNSTQIWAWIKPIGTQQFYGYGSGASPDYNTDNGPTHVIYTHYKSFAHTYDFIFQTIDVEQGQVEHIQYEILRSTDWKGMKRWIRFDVRMMERDYANA